MLFLTYWFVIYALVFFPAYWLATRPTPRLTVLLVGSAIFHTHFAGPAGVLPIIVLMVVTYLAGLSGDRRICTAAIALNISALVFYKYLRFVCIQVVGALSPALKTYVEAEAAPLLKLAPPLAISFFAFEFIHYLVDVGRGHKPIRSVRRFALFSIFWPSIVAGPVKRYQDFLPALRRGVRHVGEHDVAVGMTRVAVGLVKKFAADNLTACLALWRPHFHTFDPVWRWGFVAFLGLRILLDFSGYSDMAIGFARMHGIRLPENFRWPYLATSITDFWRRWHVSLSTWVRDYVYIALGGNRRGPARKVVNGLIAFGLCGLWHGAGWNFLVWGLYHGVGLAVCSTYRSALGPAGRAISDALARKPQVAWVLTLAFVGVGWLFFFYPLPEAIRMLGLLFRRGGP
jgi:alginate O-acetyltransferase complex protein AlgI